MNKLRAVLAAAVAAGAIGAGASAPAHAITGGGNVGNVCASITTLAVFDSFGRSINLRPCQNTSQFPDFAGRAYEFRLVYGTFGVETRTGVGYRSGIYWPVNEGTKIIKVIPG